MSAELIDYSHIDEMAAKPTQAPGGQQYTYDSTRQDSGPYYLITCGDVKPTQEMKAGFPNILPCEIRPVIDDKEWARIYDGNTHGGATRTGFDHEGEFTEEERTVYASAIKENILTAIGAIGTWGREDVKEIEAFAKVPKRDVRIEILNGILYPEKLRVDTGRSPRQAPDDLVKVFTSKGGLGYRRALTERGFEYIATTDFSDRFGSDLQTLYLSASPDIFVAFDMAETFGNMLLDQSDSQIRNPERGIGNKSTYDTRDRTWMWLLNRKGIDDAVTRALGQQGGGLNAEQLDQILAKNSGSAMTPETIATIAAQAAATVMQAMGQTKAEPQRVDDAEEFGDVTGGKPKSKVK